VSLACSGILEDAVLTLLRRVVAIVHYSGDWKVRT